MIRQPQHDYDDGYPIDARDEIAALIGAVTVTPSSLFQPDVFIPCHHDQILGLAATPQIPGGLALPDMPTEPLRVAMREAMPNTRVMAPLYRDPIVVDAATGAVSAA